MVGLFTDQGRAQVFRAVIKIKLKSLWWSWQMWVWRKWTEETDSDES